MASGLIILGEDDPMLRKLYRELLQTHGYTVIVARDGSEALALLATNVPRLLVLDVMMPGVDGIEVCRRVRPKLGERVPILFLTALDDLDTLHACIAAGGDDYVVKSGSPDILLQRVKYWLGSAKRPLGELQRRRTIAHVQSAKEAARQEPAKPEQVRRPADEPAADPGAGTNSIEVSRMAALVQRASAAAGEGHAHTIEGRLFLLGYVSGLVDQAGDRDVSIKLRFRDYLRDVLCETGIVKPDEVRQMFDNWEDMARDPRFSAAFRSGREDADAEDGAKARPAPPNLRAV